MPFVCVDSQQTKHVYICYFPLQSKALRERWLLDGAPAEEETQKRLQDDEVKTKLLEQVILRSAILCMSHLLNIQSRILSHEQLKYV